MIYEFELTSEEYRDVISALNHARDEAVHEDASTRFYRTHKELVDQYTNQEGHKATESQ